MRHDEIGGELRRPTARDSNGACGREGAHGSGGSGASTNVAQAKHEWRGLYVVVMVRLTADRDDGIVVWEVGLCGS
jgi:hypothetical protein